MIGFIDRWRDNRDREWWERHRRETRWNALATYNSECQRGIVHTAEYDTRMSEEQAQFDEEHGGSITVVGEGRSVFPMRLDPE